MVSVERSLVVGAALDLVYDDPEEFVRDVARDTALRTLGYDLERIIPDSEHFVTTCRRRPDMLLLACFNFQLGQLSWKEADKLQREYDSWLPTARNDTEKLLHNGVPLTLRQARSMYE